MKTTLELPDPVIALGEFRYGIIAVLALLGALVAVPARAQQFPSKPVRLIVPFVAGGSADVLGRVLAQRWTQQYGQQVVVENRPGSGGHVGAEAAARATPDGYTIVFGTIGIHAAYGIYSKLGYDPARDLQPVALYADVPCVIIVHPSVPAKNVKEFIALAKKNPARLNFGSAGSGSSTHMVGEWFKLVTGVNLTHIPYKGSAQAMHDLLGGQIELMFENLPTAIAQIKAGKVRALAVSTATREFGWLQVLDESERAAIVYSDPGEALDDGDHYLDATSPKRGPVLAMEGEIVPAGGVYIRKSKIPDELWGRLQLAASGKL